MTDAEQTLRDFLDKILDEKNYKPREIKIKAIPTDGGNYTSVLFIVNVSSPNRDELKLFAKVGCVGENLRLQMNADWLYGNERFVYTELVKIYKDIEDELNIPNEYKYLFPQFYGCKEDRGKETVVLENLTESGYKTFDRFKSMDWEHASAGVENLAKFHALSFAFAKYHPEEYNELTLDLKFKITFDETQQNDFAKEMWEKMINASLQILKEDQRKAVGRVLVESQSNFTKYNNPIGNPVIVHGDYRMSNLLFRKQDDTLQAITVDYQTVYAGTPVCDLIYFIALGSDEEFRKQYYDKLLDHYYTKLEEALKRFSVDPLEAYPKTKFNSDLKEMLPYAVLLGVTVLPVVTVDAASAPKVDGDADGSSFIMAPNEQYAERFRGLINDLCKWGAI
ncbi:uncharacterized protein LOC113398251 [Vanessa tameamea]|uniref:Uncharacterized protein LOC113398251 n=1 Tax=Vanessa tameamea TaxID=334116 RepID=A0A8B8I8P0_VANTA|nr:uncharacterized protein LOC113398251 [Vanessa tameamea]